MAQNSAPAPGVTESAPAALRELLRGYVRTALQNNPQLLQNEADSRAAEHRIGEARGNLYPRVALSATASNERQDREQTQVVTFDQRAGQVRVIMPLYDRTAKAQLAQRQSASVSADWRLTDVREQLLLRVVESYIELVRSLRLATLAQENLKNHRAYVAQIKEIARFDVGRSADVSTAVARTSLAESVLISRIARLDAARTQWRQLTGTSAPADLPDAYAVDLPPDLDSVLAVALTGHPALQLAQADIVVARDGVELAAAPYKPKLNVEANSRFGSDWGGFVGTQTSRYVGVSAEIPVFSGFADRYAGKAAAEQVQAAQHAYDRIRDELRRRTEQAWYDLQSNAASLRSFEDYARSAQSMVEATRNQFRIGRRTLLDVLNAENELFTARSNIASTRQDLTLASWRLHSVRGRVAAELDL
jgi:adhesin transport system outer membrane protein